MPFKFEFNFNCNSIFNQNYEKLKFFLYEIDIVLSASSAPMLFDEKS